MGAYGYQFQPSPIDYQCDINDGVEIYQPIAPIFPSNPDPSFKKIMEIIPKIDSKSKRFLTLAKKALLNPHLWNLLIVGIRTGLSHGTMDIIYRIGVDENVGKILDCLELARGSLERRYLIVDQMRVLLDSSFFSSVVSYGGGSCVIPIEAIYQSNDFMGYLYNFDHSEKALNKSRKTLHKFEEISKISKIKLIPILASVQTESVFPGHLLVESKLLECTGLWEYLSETERHDFLSEIKEKMVSGDRLVLTALIKNPDQEFFKAVGFDNLYPQDLSNLIETAKQFLTIERIVINSNKTYATLILST